MSHSASKNRHKRVVRRHGHKQFRQAEKRALRGDRPRKSYFSDRWGRMGTLSESYLP